MTSNFLCHIQIIFQKFDVNHKLKVDLEAYKQALAQEPDLLEIFDFLNRGLTENYQASKEKFHQYQLNQNYDLKVQSLAIGSNLEKMETFIENKISQFQHQLQQQKLRYNTDTSQNENLVSENQKNMEDFLGLTSLKNQIQVEQQINKPNMTINKQFLKKQQNGTEITFKVNSDNEANLSQSLYQSVELDQFSRQILPETIEKPVQNMICSPSLRNILFPSPQNSDQKLLTPAFGMNQKTEIKQILPVILPTETDYIDGFENQENQIQENVQQQQNQQNEQNLIDFKRNNSIGSFLADTKSLWLKSQIQNLASEFNEEDQLKRRSLQQNYWKDTKQTSLLPQNKARKHTTYQPNLINSMYSGDYEHKSCSFNEIDENNYKNQKIENQIPKKTSLSPQSKSILTPNSHLPPKYISLTLQTLKSLQIQTHQIHKQLQQMQQINQFPLQNQPSINTNQQMNLTSQVRSLIPSQQQAIKRRKKRAIFKFNKKNCKIDFVHQNWNIVLNMMIGIQMAVKSVVIQNQYQLNDHDFKLKYQFELIPHRSTNSNDSFKICNFYDYAPYVFNEIRKQYDLENNEYLKSMGFENLLTNILKGDLTTPSELVTQGKSGSFFYYSSDGHFLLIIIIQSGQFTLKTIAREEFHFLQKILRNYYSHLEKNPNTLLIPLNIVHFIFLSFFGLHKLRVKKQKSIKNKKLYFVIMKNAFYTAKDIQLRYDIKGSTYLRETKDPQILDFSVARKDLNAIQTNFKIFLSEQDKRQLLEQIQNDSQFFEKNNIIDYSLLIGIHNVSQEENELQALDKLNDNASSLSNKQIFSSRGVFYSVDRKYIYYIAIIDYLTAYSLKKKIEHAFKIIIQGSTISAIPPIPYSKRFQNFISELLDINVQNHIPELQLK